MCIFHKDFTCLRISCLTIQIKTVTHYQNSGVITTSEFLNRRSYDETGLSNDARYCVRRIGGNDANIRVVQRQEGDSSLDVLLAAFPGFKELVVTEKAKTTFSDPETEDTVLNTENVIAYGSYSNVKALNVTTLTIDGKSPTDADYPYVGTLGLVYKEANHTGSIKKFVEFATSDAAHEVITSAGGIPLP